MPRTDQARSARDAPSGGPQRLRWRALCIVGAGLGLAACARVGLPEVAIPGSGSDTTRQMVENRVWIEEGDAAAPGTFLAFLADGTLVMDSCVETWRLAPWRWVEGSTLVWQEDAASLRAEVALVGGGELVLVMDPGGENASRSFTAARAPVVCGDL